MRVYKIFNNNVVATITDDNKEAVVQGSGIGFRKKVGDLIDSNKVEKLFVIQDEEKARFYKLMENTSIEYLQISQEIADEAKEKLDIELSNMVLISLTDHISFAVERYKQNVNLPNLMLNEIKVLYPKEFSIGVWGLDKIRETIGIQLEMDEAGYIAIHIVNARLNVGKDNTTNILKLSKGVLDIIFDIYHIDLKDDTLDTHRLLTHLKFLAQRIFMKETVSFQESEDIYDLLIRKDPDLKRCLHEITSFVENTFSYQLSTEEQVYLMIHLLRNIK
ncbi:PRD domain-containing protein [Paenibacillus sp. GCM10028914]|uniref:PRD domain-containing protein n=1 Tax=Paenibacillus sp. GCM10028914 TaxID=3273416 RepID=UPI0036131013